MKALVNGFEMDYSDAGAGLPVVFIHGYPLSQEMWGAQAEGLSDALRVITPDLRGHGASQSVPGPYSMELFADDIAALLDALEIRGKVAICGLSMGGYVAFAFQRKYPQRMSALILAATRAAPDSAQARAGRETALQTARSEGIAAVAEGMLPKMLAPERLASDAQLVEKIRSIMMSVSPQGMIGDLEGLRDRPDSRPGLQAIRVPTLILHGADDQIIPPQEAEEMQAAIPGAKLQVFASAGHLLNMEQPEAFNAAVSSFLAGMKPQEQR